MTTASSHVESQHAAPAKADWVAVVANPYSGAGKNRQIVKRLEQALRGRGLEPRVLWNLMERGAVLRDTARLAGCRCVIVAGGDGTVADVFNEMAEGASGDTSNILPGVAVMPIGNENLFARQFGYRNPEQIADAVARGQTMGIDLGEVIGTDDNGRPHVPRLFTLMISAGFDAEVVHRVQQWRQAGGALRRARRWSYVRPTLRAALGYRYPRVMLRADGYEVTGCHAMVFNLPQYACGLKFAPNCQANDGLLHWVVFEKRGMAALAGYLARVAMGRHIKCAGVQWGAAKEIRIVGEDGRTEVRPPRLELSGAGVPVQVDGDPGGFTPMHVRIRSHAARIVVT